MADKKDKDTEAKEFEWTPYAELRLLHAMYDAMGISVPIKTVKDKINAWYDLKAADEIFPDDEFSEEEFSLPIKEFPQVASSKPLETSSKKRKH